VKKSLFVVALTMVVSFLSATVSTTAYADELPSIVLVGDREPVLQLIAKSLDAEFSGGFSGGQRERAPNGVGYRVHFKALWTGGSQLIANIAPLGEATQLRLMAMACSCKGHDWR
jgi:hypothetical protein